jgi:hypothetical protein
MLSYLRAAFLSKWFGRGMAHSEGKHRQRQTTRSEVRPSLEPLEDRLALSAVGSVDATSLIQSAPLLVALEQQFARNVAGFLTTEAQVISSLSPPVASLLQSEAQLIMSFLPQATTPSNTTMPHSTSSNTAGIHEYPIPPNPHNVTHPWT